MHAAESTPASSSSFCNGSLNIATSGADGSVVSSHQVVLCA